MVQKNKRTINVYLQAGASARLYKEAGSKFVKDISKVLPSADTDRLLKLLNRIDAICSKAEDNMFRDHPDLSDEYLDTFYGDLRTEPRNDTDKKVIDLARETAQELFNT